MSLFIFLPMFLAKDKNPYLLTNILAQVQLNISITIVNKIATNEYQQSLNEVHFHHFFSSVILFSVLPNNFIVSGIKISRQYPDLILNVFLFSILFT